MEQKAENRFDAVIDHVAVESQNLAGDVQEYERLGFQVETVYDDWAMLRDARGFGLALLGPGSKHPPHFGLLVETLEELQAAAEREGRPIREHRDRSISFYTRGIAGRVVEVIYYPPEYEGQTVSSAKIG
ncbi:MAG: VOC family protein [bacterium]